MPETTQKLILELQAKVDKYNSDIRKAARQTKDFQNSAVNAFSKIEKSAEKVKSVTKFLKLMSSGVLDLEKRLTKLQGSATTTGKLVGKSEQEYKKLKDTVKELKIKIRDLNSTNRDSNSLVRDLKKKFAELNKQLIATNKRMLQLERSTSKTNQRIRQSSDSLFKFSNVAKGVFAALSARQFVNFADEITLADNQLRNATTSAEQFTFVQMELNRIANDTRQNVNVLTSVFSKFTRAGQEAGFSTKELLEFTEQLTKAFKLEGNSVNEVNSILLQLVQSFRKGNIDGEEFRALSEGSTLALQALSKQMGVNIGDLKDLGAQGKIAPRDLVEGLKGISQQIDDEFATLEPTFGEIGARLGNAFAVAFRGSAFDKTVDNFKQLTIDAVDSVERFFTGVESKTAPQLKALIADQIKEVERLNGLQEKGILDYGRAILLANEELVKLNQRAKDLIETQSKLTGDQGGEGAVTPRKPSVKFDAGDDRTIDRAKRRLEVLEESAEAEVQLAQAVEDRKITIEEASAQAEAQRENDRLQESFTRTLEALNIKNETIAEVEALAKELGFEKLTEDEQAILDLKQRFLDAEVALNEKQLKKLQKIQEVAAKNKQQLTLSAGGRLLGAIANLADKGSTIEKIAAKGSIIASTAAGIMRQFKDLPQPLAGISAAAIALEGVAALSAVGGGGSIPSGGGGGGAGSGTDGLSSAQQDFAEETTGLEVTESTIEGTQTMRIEFATDSGDDLINAFAAALNEGQRKGQF